MHSLYNVVIVVVENKSQFNSHIFVSMELRNSEGSKCNKFSHLDKSMKFGTYDLHAILVQNFDGSNLRF